jgi:hypothetical protein
MLTPPSYYTTYYSTQKARQLGETYSENLDQLVGKIANSPVGKLQFANAIVSISMGFFTYSTSQPPDERYLEAMLAMPDILEETSDINVNIDRLFSQYGREILSILASDAKVASDQKITGYGLNFSWRSLTRTPSGPRLGLAGAVIYARKEKIKRFLNRQIEQDELLGTSVLFVRQGDQPAQQIRYSSPSPQPHAQSPVVQEAKSDDVPTPPVGEATQPKENDRQQDETQRAVAVSAAPELPPSASPSPPQVSQLAVNEKKDEQKPVVAKQSEPPRYEMLFDAQQKKVAQPPPRSLGETSQPEHTQAAIPSIYLVQLSFSELAEALRWSELLGRGGYTISTDITRADRTVRLRIRSFPSFPEASHFLTGLRAQGLQGQILQIAD